MTSKALDGLRVPLAALMIEMKERERADVLAFLRKRQAAAETVAARWPEDADRARIVVQNISILIEMIEQGLHVGDAALMAALESQAKADDEAEGTELTSQRPSVESVSRPDAGRSASATSETMDVTAGETAPSLAASEA